MKSCIMAAWLLTVSFGNLIVVILAGAKLTEDMVRFAFSHFCKAYFVLVQSLKVKIVTDWNNAPNVSW